MRAHILFGFNPKNSYADHFPDIHKVCYVEDDFISRFLVFLADELGCDTGFTVSIAKTLYESMYSNKTFYHTPVHILSIFDFAITHKIEITNDIELAIWFHDAIYRPQSKNNEKNSNLFMCSLLNDTKINPTVIRNASYYIEATAEHLKDYNYNVKGSDLMLDLDMSGFAATDAVFDQQNKMIELEFCQPKKDGYGYSLCEFLNGRLMFLNALKSKKSIYRTERFLKEFEAKAQSNLSRLIEQTQARINAL